MRMRKLMALCAGVALVGGVGLAGAQTFNSDEVIVYSAPPSVIYTTPVAREEVLFIAPLDLGPSNTVVVSRPDMSTVNNPRGTIYDPADTNYSN